MIVPKDFGPVFVLREPLMACRGLLYALLALLHPFPAKAQELRYKFQAGASTAYTSEQKQSMKVAARGQEFDMRVTTLMDFAIAVDSVDSASGSAKVKYKFDHVRMSLQGSPGDDFDLDTKSDKAPEGKVGPRIAPLFKALVGNELTATISQRGEVSDVKIPEKVQEQLKALASAGGSLGGLFSEDQLRQIMRDPVLVLPKEKVANGSNWPQTLELKMGDLGKMKITTTCTYAGKAGPFEKIDQKMDVHFEPAGGAEADFNLKTKEATGTVLFDNAKGRVQEATTKTVNDLDVGPIGTVSMTQTTSLKVKP